MSVSSFRAVIPGIGVPLLPKVWDFFARRAFFFFLRYAIELPTLHFGGGLYCFWADSKRSRRVNSVELRAAFVRVNFVHIRIFSHLIVVRPSIVKRQRERFYRGFPSYGPCVFGFLATPRGHYLCKKLCGSLPLAIQSQDCYIILLLSSHDARGDVTVP